jgi:hypothetical protein
MRASRSPHLSPKGADLCWVEKGGARFHVRRRQRAPNSARPVVAPPADAWPAESRSRLGPLNLVGELGLRHRPASGGPVRILKDPTS